MFHNKYAAATAQLQDSLKAHPQDARLHANYALVLNYQTKQQQALEQALAAQKLAPNDGYIQAIVTRVQDWNNQLTAPDTAGAGAGMTGSRSRRSQPYHGAGVAHDIGAAEARAGA